MFFRFGVALVLAVLISIAGIALEKWALELKRKITFQSYQIDKLRDLAARQRVVAQELSAPERLAKEVDTLSRTEKPENVAKPDRPDFRSSRPKSSPAMKTAR